MKLELKDLLNKKRTTLKFDLELQEESFFDGYEQVKFLAPIKFNGSATMIEGVVELHGLASTRLELTCSRCLQTFPFDLELELFEKFSNVTANEDEDIIFMDSDTLDITQIIEYNISTALPVQRLCKENCKGLCQHCGTDLNKSTCSCGVEDVDPRLAKLRDLLK